MTPVTQVTSLGRGRRRVVDWAIVEYKGFPHLLWVRVMRRAMLNLCVERDDIDSMEMLANKIDCSRSTISRLFSGRNTSLPILLKVLDVLQLRFEDVCYPVEGDLLMRLMEGAVNRNGVVTPVVNPLTLSEIAALIPPRPALPAVDRRRRRLTAGPGE